MSIVDFSFIIFVLMLTIIYYSLPKRKWIALLVGSIYFYISYNWKMCVPILISIISIYLSGIKLENIRQKMDYTLNKVPNRDKNMIKGIYKGKQKKIVIIAALINIGILIYFKFFNILMIYLIRLLNLESGSIVSFFMPLGISFYSMQAVGYVIDIYRGGVCERNIAKLSLFLTYFPLMTQGPIVKYKSIEKTLFKDNIISYNKIKNALLLMLWGYYKKLIIADRLYPLIEEVYNNYTSYSGSVILLATISYAIQLYCDFSGGIDVVRGVSELFGIALDKNFERPYFSKSLSEFWRRWHISLGTWFREYVFLPISISKTANKISKKLRKHMNPRIAKQIPVYISLGVVWLLNGLWHGAGSKYLLFGFYQGIIIIWETWHKNNRIITKTYLINSKLFNILKTFTLVCIGWIIIRVQSASDIVPIFKNIITNFNIYDLNMNFLGEFYDYTNILVLISAILILIMVSLIQRRENFRDWLEKRNVAIRWSIYYYIVINLIVLSYYSGDITGGFIYAQF